MRKKFFAFLGLVLLLATKAYAYDNGDFQVWNTESEEMKINDKLKVTLEEEFRWGNDARQFFYQHYDTGIIYTMSKHLNIGAGYRHVLSLQSNDWKVENEPYVCASLSQVLKGFALESRSRLEYRHFNYKADAGRYRNKFTAKLPWKFTALKIQPYLSDEIFYIFGGTCQFNENRAYAGFSMDFTKNVKAELYYLQDGVKNSKGKWIGANVLGSKIKIAF